MLLVIAAVIAASVPARTAVAQDRANAEELFQLGKSAMARQEVTKACNYFQASLSADFALGTLLNLAICHEQAGKIASAWLEYRTLEDRSRRATPPQVDRAQFAHDHAEALRSRLSRLRVVLSPEAIATTGLVVKIDGVTAAPELFEAGVPVDVGKRKVTATAPDHEGWSQVIVVDDERLKLETTIPPLRRLASKPVVATSSISLDEVERVAAERSRRTVGFVVGGIGVAVLATGAVFGVLAIGASDEAKCPATCYATTADGKPNDVLVNAKDAYQRADTLGWVSNITLGAGLIGLGAGAYLILTAGSTKAAVHVAPVPLVGGGALTLGGSL